MVSLDALFADRSQLVIGRSLECDICLPHPSVSRTHVVLERQAEGLKLSDLKSVNGVWVNGRRLEDPAVVRPHVRFGVGPYLFCQVGSVFHTLDSSRSLRLEARGLEKLIHLPSGPRKLLDNIHLAVEPGEFVCLLGPSGSGKSTLMDCLNGRRPASGGLVLANGENFYRHFDSFRQSLGYVPQKDIVHGQLSVYKALYYTAQLRLPTDTEPAELRMRINEVLRIMELEPHQNTLIANLSGGQIKRVSLGAELLARPCLLYIDEATSGLDAGTEARMMRLFRQLADEGRSVICITHNVDNIDLAHLTTVLCSGKLVFFGPPAEARRYFDIDRLSELYDRLADRSPEQWEIAFQTSPLYREYVQQRLQSAAGSLLLPEGLPKTDFEITDRGLVAPGADGDRAVVAEPVRRSAPAAPPVPGLAQSLLDSLPRPRTAWRQFCVLTARYTELLWRDPRTLRLLALQAPIVALFFLIGFTEKPYQKEILIPRPLAPDERRVLQGLHDLIEVLAGDHELTADEQAALEQIKLSVPNRDQSVTAADLLLLFRLLQKAPGADKLRPALEKVTITFADPSGGQSQITCAQLMQAPQHLHQAGMLTLLLKEQGPVLPDKRIVDPRYTYMLVFIVVITVLWFGCNNAGREIVKEESIYLRERSVNLHIGPYVISKFLVLSAISAVQVLLLMLVLYGTLAILHVTAGHDFPAPAYMLPFVPQYCVLFLLITAGVAMGLLLSACVASPDRAATLLPYVLIPQIILAGGFLPIRGEPLHTVSLICSPAYWAYRAIHRGATDLPDFLPGHADYDDSVWLACAALAIQIVVLLLLAAWFLKRKDVWKGA